MVLEENPLEMVSDRDGRDNAGARALGDADDGDFGTAGDNNRFNALSSIRDDGMSDRLFDLQSLQGTAS